MKKLFLFISALSLLGFGAVAQKKEKISKVDKEFLAAQADGIYAKFETNKKPVEFPTDRINGAAAQINRWQLTCFHDVLFGVD